VFDSELRFAPQLLQYHFKDPANETISQFALPVFITIPVNERLTFDVGTSYARTRLTSERGVSEINGLTDTHLRGNLTLGNDLLVLTAGLNLPTGKSSVTLEQFGAAALIGNDFLGFPISSMGTGVAITAGAAVARPIGEWNIGFGASMRRSAAYEPLIIADQSLRFQPGNEYRARVGLDRPVGAGRLALGLTYSAFGKDDAGGSVYNTGDRIIAQGIYTDALGGNTVTLAAYNVIRGKGSYASGDPAGRENIADAFGSIAFDAHGTSVEPSIELRHWFQSVIGRRSGTTTIPDRTQTSLLGTFGVRTHVDYSGVRIVPSIGYTLGSLAVLTAAGTPTTAGMTGFRAQVAMRVAP
jgi:hypothetical protein